MEKKILVSDSAFLECVDKLAIQITEEKFGKRTWIEGEDSMVLSDKAQDFFNDKFDEYETIINNTLNVWNKQSEI